MTPATPSDETLIEGYASLFWKRDLNNDVVAKGAFSRSLLNRPPERVRMLHQHAPRDPIGVWDVVREDGRGLFVRGRIITATPQALYAARMVQAGALDGLSIGFVTQKARKESQSALRVLTEIELWEVSLVTFPMLPDARLRLSGAKSLAA